MKPKNAKNSIVQPVTIRQATPEELEKYRKLDPPTDRFGKPLRRAVKIKG